MVQPMACHVTLGLLDKKVEMLKVGLWFGSGEVRERKVGSLSICGFGPEYTVYPKTSVSGECLSPAKRHYHLLNVTSYRHYLHGSRWF